MRLAAAALAVAASAVGCSERPMLVGGSPCELSSECDDRLVCRLGKCRTECRKSRDCPLQRECLLDEEGFGACQTEDEEACVLASDCDVPLVCRFGQCVNECDQDRDCPSGSRCLESDAGAFGCRGMEGMPCELHSQCGELACGIDGICREACVVDRDCTPGARCVLIGDVHRCVDPGADAGLPSDGGV